MAYREVTCGLCDAALGHHHGHEVRVVIRQHFQMEHPKELEQMEEANRLLLTLQKKYKYDGYL